MRSVSRLNRKERAELTDRLLLAAQSGDAGTVQELLQAGGEIGLALVRAVRLRDQATVRLLLDLGADPDAGGENASALVLAEDEPMAALLLDSGADIDAPGRVDYYTALADACLAGLESMVRFLIARGADVNRRIPIYDQGNRGGSPWQLAWKYPTIRQMLEAAGATPEGHDMGADALRFRDLDRERKKKELARHQKKKPVGASCRVSSTPTDTPSSK